MRTDFDRSRRTASAVLFAGMALSGCAAVAPPLQPSLPQRIAAAHSRADHEALAAYFQGEATAARAKAAEHREMILAYQRQVQGKRSNPNMATHCKSLIQGYEGMVADYERLADSHLQMAAQSPP